MLISKTGSAQLMNSLSFTLTCLYSASMLDSSINFVSSSSTGLIVWSVPSCSEIEPSIHFLYQLYPIKFNFNFKLLWLGQFRITNQLSVSQSIQRNPRLHGTKMQTPHRMAPIEIRTRNLSAGDLASHPTAVRPDSDHPMQHK